MGWGAPDITVHGTRLETASWGPPPEEAATLVLLHEGLGCIALWRDLPERLATATGLGVFAYSRAGYGASDPCALPRPIDYMEREALALPAVLDAAGIRRAVLVGHSDGGSIAALAAGTLPDPRIRGIVLLAPHFFVEDCCITAIAAAGRAYRDGDLKRRLARYHRDVDTAFLGWHDAWLTPAFRDWNIEDCQDYIRVPVLALQGLADPYGTAAQVTALPDRVPAPAEIHLLDGCGHAPHAERPGRSVHEPGQLHRRRAEQDQQARLEREERLHHQRQPPH